MNKKLLKGALFGYSKAGVCEYIANLNEDFSKKLLNVVQETDARQKALQEKNTRLEEENRALREEADRVSRILLDTKRYAEELRSKAEEEDLIFRAENRERYEAQLQRLYNYRENVNAIRDSLRAVLEDFDRELAQHEQRINEAGNMPVSDGECSEEQISAPLSLEDGFVDVFETQVSEDCVDEISGEAV